MVESCEKFEKIFFRFHSREVYDQIIGMVDSTNLHIFGITCSLAWQLPHKTFFNTDQHTKEAMHNSKISISDVVYKTDKIDNKQSSQATVQYFDS